MSKEAKMITEKDVLYVASLSRVNLQQEEIDKITQNLEDILQYIAKLEKLDVSQIQPTSHVLPIHNVYREDKPSPSLSQQEALKIAPTHAKGAFKVPKVIEE